MIRNYHRKPLRTLLMESIFTSLSTKSVDNLVNIINAQETDEGGYTALEHLLSQHFFLNLKSLGVKFDAYVNLIKYLIDNTIRLGLTWDLNKKANYVGYAPLHFAVALKQHTLVHALLNQGVNPHETTNKNQTALHIAAYNDDIESAQLLLMKNVSVNSMDIHRETALNIASNKKHNELTELLLNATNLPLSKKRMLDQMELPPCSKKRCSY